MHGQTNIKRGRYVEHRMQCVQMKVLVHNAVTLSCISRCGIMKRSLVSDCDSVVWHSQHIFPLLFDKINNSSTNHHCYGNATIYSLCTVVDLHVAIKNINPLNAVELQNISSCYQ
jgi:hypothetical protein